MEFQRPFHVEVPSTSGVFRNESSIGFGYRHLRHIRCKSSPNELFLRQIGGIANCRSGFFAQKWETLTFAKGEGQLNHKDVKGHFGCVNAIEFSPNEQRLMASGGDDLRVLLWCCSSLCLSARPQPLHALKSQHQSNIFCLCFSPSTPSLLWSAGNDGTVQMHNVETGNLVDIWRLDDAVYAVSVHPQQETLFLTASEDGNIRMWDVRNGTGDSTVLAYSHFPMQSVMYNPVDDRLVAVANSEHGVHLFDTRRANKPLCKYESEVGAMYVRWNSQGNRLLAIRRKSQPILYTLSSCKPAAIFDHPGYYNSCTMKSCTFAGSSDEFIIAGSDDWNVYLWKIPNLTTSANRSPRLIRKARQIFHGHRSIVNQVRYSSQNQLIVTSGVEKIIKLWTGLPLVGGIRDCSIRHVFKGDLSGAMQMIRSRPNVSEPQDEDTDMLAFFDSLVQYQCQVVNSSSSEDDRNGISADENKNSIIKNSSGNFPRHMSISNSWWKLPADSAKDGQTLTEMIVHKRNRLEMEQYRRARRRGRFENGSLFCSNIPGNSTNQVRKLLNKATEMSQNPQDERLKLLQKMRTENESETIHTTFNDWGNANKMPNKDDFSIRSYSTFRRKRASKRIYRDHDSDISSDSN